MDEVSEESLNQGILFLCNRDEAKQLFAARTPPQMREFLHSHFPVSSQRAVVCSSGIERMQELLMESEVDDEDGVLLKQFYEKARVLIDEDGLHVRMIRPDMVDILVERICPIELIDDHAEDPPEWYDICSLFEKGGDEKAAMVYARTQQSSRF